MIGRGLAQTLLTAARADPQRPYLLAAGRQVTYEQAVARVRALARKFRGPGRVGGRGVIAVCIDDPEQLLYAVWACVFAGRSLAFCPRLADAALVRPVMEEIAAPILLTDVAALKGRSWSVDLPELMAEPDGDEPEDDALVPAGTSAGTEAAFLFQTSGTAGEPKWVQCHYWKCFEVVECMWREGALDHARGQTVLLTPPLFHSYGLSALFEYTRAAGTIVFPSPGSRLGPLADLQDGRLADRVTAIEGVPYFHQQLARLASRLKLPALMHLGFGGGALDESAVATLRAVFPALTYSVRYGLTETPSVVSHKLFRPPYAEDWLSSGRILPIYRVCIGDADGRALAPGSEGEIIVSGTCVCRYFGAGADPANDTLRTGDIGRLTAQGELVVVGRRSAFLKHLGYRLSPEHIESVLRAVPGVVDCRVVTRLSSLVAEIVAKDDLFSREGLFRHAAASLPAHAVPNEVVRVERIPRTASGKIMRH